MPQKRLRKTGILLPGMRVKDALSVGVSPRRLYDAWQVRQLAGLSGEEAEKFVRHHGLPLNSAERQAVFTSPQLKSSPWDQLSLIDLLHALYPAAPGYAFGVSSKRILDWVIKHRDYLETPQVIPDGPLAGATFVLWPYVAHVRLPEIAYGNPPGDPELGMAGCLRRLVRPRYERNFGLDESAQGCSTALCPAAFFHGSALVCQLRTREEVREEARLMRWDYGLSWQDLTSGHLIAYHVGEPAPAGSTLIMTWAGKEFALYHAGGTYPSYAERGLLWDDCQHTWNIYQRQPWFWIQQLPDALTTWQAVKIAEGEV
jgi:hypothetical protein